ncbi:carboxymuconolactone decarboxylase family protein [Amycolatopsis sp. GM8]|uniref:carboxymuconolactone decarboxylase family protein n=1 Tax=Amycolatopsis sp. GM8 TaxID=2896530 RepID=UPI001F2C310B|nr:carboxymuconolactone decarboxylase family protein [Amycolatopsis sp. GM8]
MTTPTEQQAAGSPLNGLARGEAPVLESLVEMNLDSMERSELDPDTYVLVRLAALVAMDAAPVSYLMTLALGQGTDLTLEQAQDVLVAIAPVVGSARVSAAAGNLLRALEMASAVEAT